MIMIYEILLWYLVLVNAAACLLMLTDKRKAKRGAWRIPEATLLGIAAIGGSVGAITGMYLFSHKTKHPKFFIGLPAILVIQVGIVVYIVTRI